MKEFRNFKEFYADLRHPKKIEHPVVSNAKKPAKKAEKKPKEEPKAEEKEN